VFSYYVHLVTKTAHYPVMVVVVELEVSGTAAVVQR
jgi:hypothetical protein